MNFGGRGYMNICVLLQEAIIIFNILNKITFFPKLTKIITVLEKEKYLLLEKRRKYIRSNY